MLRNNLQDAATYPLNPSNILCPGDWTLVATILLIGVTSKGVRPFSLGDNRIWSFSLCFFQSCNLQHLELLKAILALRSKLLEHLGSFSPNALVA